jgi:hypothetical protein
MFVTVPKTVPEGVCVATTVAPITAPSASVTRPLILDVVTCACNIVAEEIMSATNKNLIFLIINSKL